MTISRGTGTLFCDDQKRGFAGAGGDVGAGGAGAAGEPERQVGAGLEFVELLSRLALYRHPRRDARYWVYRACA